MKWDRDYVREKYGFSYLGQEGVFFPAANCKRLLVFFSSMGSDRYDRYSWFWEDGENWQETAFLFIKDDSFKYYLGDDEKPLTQTFRKIILNYSEDCSISPLQTFTVGASMGGYAAIYYASLMGLGGAITANPQISYQSARQHIYENWEKKIRSIGSQWYDLNDYIQKKSIPNIYIEFGEYPADYSAAESLITTIHKLSGNLIMKKLKWEGHTVNCLFKETILETVTYFEYLNKVQEKYLNAEKKD